jgi:1-aminocyclopropane-1-carboxylate deaminase/D-cysteine desulfhydrase-like pyridoxal-dependent ACC family enzyme
VHVTAEGLAARLAPFPRLALATLPTPIQACPRLSEQLGGPRILVKRDDMTGLAFGGNKTRQYDAILGHALSLGSTGLVSSGTLQSNHCRQIAAAAARLGLPIRLVLAGAEPVEPRANLRLMHWLGARITFVPEDASLDHIQRQVDTEADDLRREGCTPYVLDLLDYRSEDNLYGALAYAGMVVELASALEAPPSAIYLCCGSQGSATMAGTLVGVRALGWPACIVGVPAAPGVDSLLDDTLDIARRTAALLEVDLGPGEIEVVAERAGAGYGVPTRESEAALAVCAQAEGLLLDPTYTAKAMSALIDDARRERWSKEESVVFLHTGGLPLLFL